MWTDDLLQFVLKDCKTASVVTGIYAIDTLPVQVKHPAALIVNLSPSASGGSHWVVIFIDKNRRGFYFDSLGRKVPKPIMKFLRRNCIYFKMNRTQYQHDDSILCGLFCIIFIYFKVRNQNILKSFNTKDLKKNDLLVLKLVRKIKKQNPSCK